MSEPVSNAKTDGHYECLDVFQVIWTPAEVEEKSLECGILLEIWETGGILQTSVPILEGAFVELTPGDHAISATVTCCDQEIFGYLISFSVNDGQGDQWFPQSYCPPNLHCGEEERSRFANYNITFW